MAQSMKKNATRKVNNAKNLKKSRGGYPAVKVKTTSRTRRSRSRRSRRRIRGGM